MRDEWRLCRVIDVNPDEGNIANVAPPNLHDATKLKKGVAMIKLKRHISNPGAIAPHEEDDVGAGHGGECRNEQRHYRSFQRGLAASFVDRQIRLKSAIFSSYFVI